MSLLPEHKKSAEEIAQLRESLGIAVPSAPDAGPPQPVNPVPIMATQEISPSQLAPLPSAEAPAAKQVRSLRRTERIPILPVEAGKVQPPPVTHLEAAQPTATLPLLQSPKPVRSLRKSEQAPIAPRPPPPESTLPIQRHSGHELNEIRRHEALILLESAIPPPSLTAHRALIFPGYLFALAGAACFYYYELEIRITAACVIASLLVAIFIFFKKPLSRHHAAFIAVAALFVIVFGALYYFPQLSYSTFQHQTEEKSVTHKDL